MEDWSKIAEEAVRRGGNPEHVSMLSVEAEMPIFNWLLGAERIEAISRREQARNELLRLSGRRSETSYCKFVADASVEDLTAFYHKITGKEPEPDKIQAMKGECKLEGIEIEQVVREQLSSEEQHVFHDLEQSVREERQAQDDYRLRADKAQNAGDFQTEGLFTHIISEEQQHEEELTKRLREKGEPW